MISLGKRVEMKKHNIKPDFTSLIADILAKYVGGERVVIKKENEIDVVTLCGDENLKIETLKHHTAGNVCRL